MKGLISNDGILSFASSKVSEKETVLPAQDTESVEELKPVRVDSNQKEVIQPPTIMADSLFDEQKNDNGIGSVFVEQEEL